MPPNPTAVPRPNSAPPQPVRGLVLLWLLSLLGLVPLIGFLGRYSAGYFQVRYGKSGLERRLSLKGTRPFRAGFVEFVERVKRATPENARILVEPTEIKTESGSARWFLYLNLELHPREIFVRGPALASGTLVDYPRWLDLNVRPLSMIEAVQLLEDVEALGIEWRIRYPVTINWKLEAVTLERRTEQGWQPVSLPPAGILRGRMPGEEPAPSEEDEHAF